MKKFFLIFGILGLIAFGMVSCERDDDNGGTGNGNTPSTPTNPTDTTSTPTDTTATPVPDGYVDLGLPSGKIWRKVNEYNVNEYSPFYTYDEAVSQFGNRLPTKADWEELKAECQWAWMGSGYYVIGPNGNSITLPAAGYHYCLGSVGSEGSNGYYWSSTAEGSDFAWSLHFYVGSVNVGCGSRCDGRSVRLVQD